MTKTDDTYIVIPARLESKRFPGKVLQEFGGKTILQHVWELATKSFEASKVFITSDSDKVIHVAKSFGAQTFKNERPANNGTERIAEFAEQKAARYYLNIQADDPGLTEDLILQQLSERKEGIYVSTPIFESKNEKTYLDASSPKVVVGKGGRALYFSRSAIPLDRDSNAAPKHFGHIGIYLYERQALHDYFQEGVSELEEVEKLEQLRFLWMGKTVNTFVTEYVPHPIDNPADLEFWRGKNER